MSLLLLPCSIKQTFVSKAIRAAKSEFREAWKALKAKTPPDQLTAAYRAMNIRGDS